MRKVILLLLVVFLISYLIIIYLMKNDRLSFVSSFLTTEQTQLIKEYIFPYRVIKEQKRQISELEDYYSPLELDVIFRSLPKI